MCVDIGLLARIGASPSGVSPDAVPAGLLGRLLQAGYVERSAANGGWVTLTAKGRDLIPPALRSVGKAAGTPGVLRTIAPPLIRPV